MIPTEVLIEAFRITVSLADNTVNKFDDNKFVDNIVKLYGKEPTYDEFDAQVELVKKDANVSTEEKLVLLNAIAVQKDAARKREAELKAKCAEIIENGMVKRGEIATKIVVCVIKAFLTGGLSLLVDGFGKRAGELTEGEDENEEAA